MDVGKFVGMIKKGEKGLFFGYATVGDVNNNGKATLKFDGSEIFTKKYYERLNGVSMYKGDRVLVMGKNTDLIIMGVI